MSRISLMAMLAFAGVGFSIDACGAEAPAASKWPPQPPLEMRVPFEPTAFPSAGRTYLTYELHLTNFATEPLTLQRIEVLDADGSAAQPIAAFAAEQLDAMLQPVGAQNSTAQSSARRQLAGGDSVVVFIWIALDRATRIASKLRHRVRTTDSAVEGAVIGTQHTKLRVLGAPVSGANWIASNGPDNNQYHRRGILIFDGHAVISRRYAIDWLQVENGAALAGDALDNRSYHAYGETVLAVADATVIAAKDGLPDNVPRHEGFRAAVPISIDTIAGNVITLDLGGGQFAYYMHLQPGSLRVAAGERVRRGQIMARIGNSGDSREPHLHFEVTTAATLVAGEGVPYLIDRYSLRERDGAWQPRARELPLKDMVIDFGGPREQAPSRN